MIFIVGQNGDSSTHEVCRYFMHWKTPFVKIADSDTIDDFQIIHSQKGQKILISKEKVFFDLCTISAYWYRRGNLKFNHNFSVQHPDIAEEDIFNFVKSEHSTIIQFVHAHLEQTEIRIGAMSKNNLNKLVQLQLAKDVGLRIPEFVICNSKIEVQSFFDDVGTLATKGIGNNFTNHSGQIYWMFTSIVKQREIDRFPDKFAFTLFQKYVPKEYEIRVFYLHEKCYSMAIFSQQNSAAMIDYRRIRAGLNNRTVPLNLPKTIERKIIRFMKKCDMNTGSLDLIYTSNGEYVFLEVNPNGQFGMVSKPCNYFIERSIANYLTGGKKHGGRRK